MPRYNYHFRRDDDSPLRIIAPQGSLVVECGKRSAIERAKHLAARDDAAYTVYATRASDPYMGNGEPFNSPTARRIGRYAPNDI